MRKAFVLIIVILVVSFAIFMLIGDKTHELASDSMEGEKLPLDAGDLGASRDKKKTSSSTAYKRLPEMENKDLKRFEDLYQYAESKWLEKSQDLIVDDLSLSEETHEKYQVLREAFEEERWQAFESFHKKMLNNPESEVNATEYEDKVENQILGKYEKKIQNLLGPKNYKKYLQARQEFNEKLRNKQDPRKGLLLIDL